MFWDDEYRKNERVWGDGPSELAIAAVEHLQRYKQDGEPLSILDVGCGYGRDVLYFSDNLRCEILGIDSSEAAIDSATRAALKAQSATVRLQCCDFRELAGDRFDVVSIANLYHLLQQDERNELVRMAMRTLKPGGLLFMSMLSVNDPEHQGKGIPIPGEPNSYQDRVYLHLCSREELMADLAFLDIKELYEHKYDEPHANGDVHHHISWILIGRCVSREVPQ